MDVSGAALARHLNVSRQAISKAEKRGRIKRQGNGSFDLEHATHDWNANVNWAMRRRKRPKVGVRGQSSLDEERSTPDYFAAQARKEAALARLKELEVCQKESQLFPVSEGMKLIRSLTNQLTEALRAMEHRVAPQLATAGTAREVNSILRREHDLVLKAMSEAGFD